MGDLLWTLGGALIGWLIYAHWDDIVSAIKSFFYNLAEEFGIDLNVLINNFKSTIARLLDGAYYLITGVFLKDRYGRQLRVEPKKEKFDFEEIPDHLKDKVKNGYEVEATTEVRQELINQLS